MNWEYTLLHVNVSMPTHSLTGLNALGTDGWGVVGTLDGNFVILSRPLPNGEPAFKAAPVEEEAPKNVKRAKA